MVKTRTLPRYCAWLALLAASQFPGPAAAQEPVEPTIHWAYASFFGTGWYKLSDERSGYVFRATPRWPLASPGLTRMETGKSPIPFASR